MALDPTGGGYRLNGRLGEGQREAVAALCGGV
jgi:hypothetical protein